jgi:hypothetical protein
MSTNGQMKTMNNIPMSLISGYVNDSSGSQPLNMYSSILNLFSGAMSFNNIQYETYRNNQNLGIGYLESSTPKTYMSGSTFGTNYVRIPVFCANENTTRSFVIMWGNVPYQDSGYSTANFAFKFDGVPAVFVQIVQYGTTNTTSTTTTTQGYLQVPPVIHELKDTYVTFDMGVGGTPKCGGVWAAIGYEYLT